MTNQSMKIQLHNIKVQFYLKVDMFMKANGKEMKEVGEQCNYGKMDLSMKDTGKIILYFSTEKSLISAEFREFGEAAIPNSSEA